jgi:CHAT domain-containing protein
MTYNKYINKFSIGSKHFWPILVLLHAWVVILFFNAGCTESPKAVFYDPAPLLAKADSLWKTKSNHQAALNAYYKALPILETNNDSLCTWLVVQRRIAVSLHDNFDKKKESLAHIDSTLKQLQQWRVPVNEREDSLLCLLYFREIYTAREYGDLMRMKAALERTEILLKGKLFGRHTDGAKFFYVQMANLYVRLGDFDTAKNYFNESIAYEKQFNLTNFVNYNDYGSIYLTLQDYKQALEIFNSGLAKSNVDYFNRTLLHLNKSEALANLDSLPQAQLWNNLALKMLALKDEFDDDDYYLKCKIGYLENEAIIQEKKQNWTAARAFYDKILSPEQLPHMQRRDIAGYLNASANTFLEQKNYPKALEQYHAAYLKFFPNTNAPLPNPDDLPADKILADILEGKARCWAAMGQYDQSIAAYLLIPVIENQLRATHTFETSMLLALQKSRHRFNDAVDIAWDAWQKTGNRTYAEKAFLFTEMARGTLQTKGINANEALDLLTPNQQEEDKNWSNKIAICENQLSEAEEEAEINALMQEIRQLKNQQKATRTQIASTNPAYAATMGSNHILEMKDVAVLLRPGQTMLDYYLIDTHQLYVFTFDHLGNAAWNRLEWSSTTQAATIDLVRQISDNTPITPPVFSNTAQMLGQKLLVEAIGNTTSICQGNTVPKLDSALVIVPDLVLTALPYEVLLIENTTATDWSDLPYLVKKHSISYAFSASLLALQKTLTEKRKGKARLPFAGFAPTYSNNADRLDSAATDVTYCAQLFNGKAYLHPDATEAQFRTISEDAQILLFSMHGHSDHVHPGLSRLRFGDTNAGKESDNILHASELQGIPCRADLAVMSACFTGDGPVQVGEGVYSIARSFAVSGVPATAMSLWKFPVISSSNLVRDFLLGVKNQHTKDGALQHAKLTWLQDHPQSKYAHPYYWAGLVTAGDASVLKMSKKGFDYWYFALGALVLALLVGLLKRNRDKND